jgi:adenylate cyclase
MGSGISREEPVKRVRGCRGKARIAGPQSRGDTMVRLVLKRQKGKQEIFNLLEKETLIGRNDPSKGVFNDINLADTTVSRHHARVFIEGNAYCIEDLESANGTLVNDQAIRKANLVHGDRIDIGDNTLLFDCQESVTVNPLDFIINEKQLNYHKTVDSNYIILRRLSEMFLSETSPPDFLQAVIDMVMESIKSTRGVLMLIDAQGKPRYTVTRGKDVFFSDEVVRQVISDRKSLLVGCDHDASKTMIMRGTQSAICAPLLKDREVLGVIYLEDPLPGRFEDGDLILLTLFANQVATGIEKVDLNEKLHRESIIRANLERFLSPRVVELVTRDCIDTGDILLKSARVNATVLFSDIQGFTRLSEKLDPQEIADLLTTYFTLMTEAVFTGEGTLDKFMGDGLLAIFGAPFPYTDHPFRAVRAGLEMLALQKQFVASLPESKRFAIRIGINTGEIVAGYMGAPKRMEYTTIGAVVNIANRLQSLAEPGTIYLGKETYRAVSQQYPAEFVGRMETPKGQQEMEVYRLRPDQN